VFRVLPRPGSDYLLAMHWIWMWWLLNGVYELQRWKEPDCDPSAASAAHRRPTRTFTPAMNRSSRENPRLCVGVRSLRSLRPQLEVSAGLIRLQAKIIGLQSIAGFVTLMLHPSVGSPICQTGTNSRSKSSDSQAVVRFTVRNLFVNCYATLQNTPWTILVLH